MSLRHAKFRKENSEAERRRKGRQRRATEGTNDQVQLLKFTWLLPAPLAAVAAATNSRAKVKCRRTFGRGHDSGTSTLPIHSPRVKDNKSSCELLPLAAPESMKSEVRIGSRPAVPEDDESAVWSGRRICWPPPHT